MCNVHMWTSLRVWALSDINLSNFPGGWLCWWKNGWDISDWAELLSLTKLLLTEYIPSILMFAAKRRLNTTAFETFAHKEGTCFVYFWCIKRPSDIGSSGVSFFVLSSMHIDFTQYLINNQHEGDSQKLCSFVMKSKHQFNPPSPLL